MNETQTLPSVINVEGVNAFIDKDGTTWLKLDDCVRGLGLTRKRNGVEYVMWDRVREYLHQINFSQEVGKARQINVSTDVWKARQINVSPEVGKINADTFIPEYIFYRLGMKVNNPIGNAFQDKIARVILPAIRKHGFYISDQAKAEYLTSNVRRDNFELLHPISLSAPRSKHRRLKRLPRIDDPTHGGFTFVIECTITVHDC